MGRGWAGGGGWGEVPEGGGILLSERRRWSRYLVSTDPGGGSPPRGRGRGHAEQAVHRPRYKTK